MPLLVTGAGTAVIVTAVAVALYASRPSPVDPVTVTTSGSSATPSVSWSNIDDSPGAGSATSKSSAAGPAASAALFKPADLGVGWSKDASTPASASDQAFCNVPLGYSGGNNATITLVRSVPVTAVKQDVFSGGAAGTGAKALATVRSSSTKCTKWDAVEDGDQVAYEVAPLEGRATLGDGSVEYRVKATSQGLTLHVIQVYVVRGDTLSILSYATLQSSTEADIAAAESLAAKSAERLAAG